MRNGLKVDMKKTSKSNILIVSPVSNVPPFSGNSARVNDMVSLLNEIGVKTSFCLTRVAPIESRTEYASLDNFWRDSLYYINKDLSYKGTKKIAVLKFLKKLIKKLGWKMFERVLDYDIPSNYISKRMEDEYLRLLYDLKPDAVFFEYALLSRFASLTPKHILTVCDTHDCFANRNQRLRSQGINERWLNFTLKQERELLSNFDYILAIQKNEELMLTDILGKLGKVLTLDVIRPPREDKVIVPKNSNIGYIGSVNAQNVAGLNQFLELCWPEIVSAIPEAKFYIAGNIASNLNSHLVLQQGINLLGKVKSLDSFYHDVCLIVNPCMGGTGLKIKTVEALMYGKCVVSTDDGADGLESFSDFGLARSMYIDKVFAQKVIDFLSNRQLLETQGLNNIRHINSKFNENREQLKGLLCFK